VFSLVLGISIKPTRGEILDGKTPIRSLNTKEWRNICGVLMQDGFIFSDTIENNICDGMNDQNDNKDGMINALKTSNLYQDIEKLPLKYNTIIGPGGEDLSQGQKQSLLIARAIYKAKLLIS